MGLFTPSRDDIVQYAGEFIKNTLAKLDDIESLRGRLIELSASNKTNIENIELIHENTLKIDRRLSRLEEKLESLEKALKELK